MTRPLRIKYPGEVYHLTARGCVRNDIYRDDHDLQNYLSVLSGLVKRYNLLGIYYATVSRVACREGQ